MSHLLTAWRFIIDNQIYICGSNLDWCHCYNEIQLIYIIKQCKGWSHFLRLPQFIFHEHYCPSPTKTMMYCQKSVVGLLLSPNTTLVRLSQDQKGYIFFLLAERCEQKIFWGLWFQFSCICSKVLLLLGPSGKIIIPYMITYRINQLLNGPDPTV